MIPRADFPWAGSTSGSVRKPGAVSLMPGLSPNSSYCLTKFTASVPEKKANTALAPDCLILVRYGA